MGLAIEIAFEMATIFPSCCDITLDLSKRERVSSILRCHCKSGFSRTVVSHCGENVFDVGEEVDILFELFVVVTFFSCS